MKTTPTTAINNLLIDYNKKITDLQGHIEYNQKLIEKDKATISSLKEKINTLHEVLDELNRLLDNTTSSKDTKDTNQLTFKDLSPQNQCNGNAAINSIKPLTEEQIKKLSETFTKQNNSSILDNALKSLESLSKDTYCFVDVKYNDHEKWPMDM